jgi:putative hemolysin
MNFLVNKPEIFVKFDSPTKRMDEIKIISTEEFAKATKLDKLGMPGLASLFMELMKINEVNETFNKIKHLKGIPFIDKLLEILGVTVEFDEEDLKNLPKDGAFLAIANHPYGGIEGLVLIKLTLLVNPESKQLSNFLLKKVPNLSDLLIAVNPFETIDNPASISGIKTALGLLKEGVPISVFPAGEVSTYKLSSQSITDRQWHPVVAKLAIKAKVPVVPVYFHGNNSLLFNLLSFIHPMLRTAKLPSEMFNKQGHVLKLRIGKPIKIEDTPYANNPTKLLDYLRARTYALGAGLEEHKKLFSAKSLFKIEKKQQEIVAEMSSKFLEKDIAAIQDLKTWTEKNYEVYIAPSTKIPNILKEIGRLREITFREIGEGTNKSIDLDAYDIYYHHLFIWDKEAKKLVGAYRIGKGNDIYYSYGKKGFYTAEIFKVDDGFAPILKKSLELGRSWIRKEYQQKPLPLFLLWKGILKFIADNSEHVKYLIGPVSISNSFSKISKTLMVDYILKNHFDENLAQYIKPRKKFKFELDKDDMALLVDSRESLKDLDQLISDIEQSNMKIPVLLRQYLGLNGKIICFNIDPKFSNSLDGFLIVDMENIPLDKIEKLQ